SVGDGHVTGLREHLAARLPEYMIPNAIVFLQALPLTPSGKVDRKALLAPEYRPEQWPGQWIGRTSGYLAPRDALELSLVRIWQDVLGAPGIGVLDNFFEAGGHSLLAVRLVSAIRHEMGVDLPLAALFTAPVLAQQAELLRKQGSMLPSNLLVPLQSNGAGRPLFLVHPGGGTVFCYGQLVRELGPGRPVFGIQAAGLDAGTVPHRSYRDMAAAYVERIRSVQPNGPYEVGGFSLGGVVAFEVACQLRQAQQEVSTLFLLDSVAPHHYHGIEPDDLRSILAFAQMMQGLSGVDLLRAFVESERIDPSAGADAVMAALSPRSSEQRLELFLECGKGTSMLSPSMSMDELRRLYAVFGAIANGVTWYHPDTYEGRVVIFRTTDDHSRRLNERDMGWSRYLHGETEVVDLPGDHFALLSQPVVAELGLAIRRILGWDVQSASV
ncbi:MAG: thioesterase domain-containing protein, partial [Pseudomonadota bacterium]